MRFLRIHHHPAEFFQLLQRDSHEPRLPFPAVDHDGDLSRSGVSSGLIHRQLQVEFLNHLGFDVNARDPDDVRVRKTAVRAEPQLRAVLSVSLPAPVRPWRLFRVN